jgi:hypothetical protein
MLYNPFFNPRTKGKFLFTENMKIVRNSTNAKLKIGFCGSYCYSEDNLTCYSDQGQSCDQFGYMCSYDSNLNPI